MMTSISNANVSKVQELGTIQAITHKVFDQFLAVKGIGAGTNAISSNQLFATFIQFLSENQYLIRPSNRAFGRAATKRLPYCKKKSGTHYLINQ